MSLVVEAFGKANNKFENLLKIIVRLAVAEEEGMFILPLYASDKKGGACVIMNHQFMWALCVSIVRGMANNKLSRLYYVRATVEEANHDVQENYSDNRWKPSQQDISS